MWAVIQMKCQLRVTGSGERRGGESHRLPFHQVCDDIPQPQEQYVVCGNGKN